MSCESENDLGYRSSKPILVELDFDTIDKAPDFYVYSPCTIDPRRGGLTSFIEIDFKEDLQEDLQNSKREIKKK